MSNPFLGEMRIISWNFAPQGWAFCNGQLLPINQNQALFSLLGTTYGGDGRVNFALPDFRGRIPVHFGNGFTLGQRGGEAAHTLISSEMPAHNHFAQGTNNAGNQRNPDTTIWATVSGLTPYSSNLQNSTAMHPSSVSNVGGSQPHNNMSPYLVLNFIIALIGIFPSQT